MTQRWQIAAFIITLVFPILTFPSHRIRTLDDRKPPLTIRAIPSFFLDMCDAFATSDEPKSSSKKFKVLYLDNKQAIKDYEKKHRYIQKDRIMSRLCEDDHQNPKYKHILFDYTKDVLHYLLQVYYNTVVAYDTASPTQIKKLSQQAYRLHQTLKHFKIYPKVINEGDPAPKVWPLHFKEPRLRQLASPRNPIPSDNSSHEESVEASRDKLSKESEFSPLPPRTGW